MFKGVACSRHSDCAECARLWLQKWKFERAFLSYFAALISFFNFTFFYQFFTLFFVLNSNSEHWTEKATTPTNEQIKMLWLLAVSIMI